MATTITTTAAADTKAVGMTMGTVPKSIKRPGMTEVPRRVSAHNRRHHHRRRHHHPLRHRHRRPIPVPIHLRRRRRRIRHLLRLLLLPHHLLCHILGG